MFFARQMSEIYGDFTRHRDNCFIFIFFVWFNFQMLEVRLLYEINDIESPDGEQVPPLPTPGTGSNPQSIAPQSHPSTSSSSSDGLRDNVPCLK